MKQSVPWIAPWVSALPAGYSYTRYAFTGQQMIHLHCVYLVWICISWRRRRNNKRWLPCYKSEQRGGRRKEEEGGGGRRCLSALIALIDDAAYYFTTGQWSGREKTKHTGNQRASFINIHSPDTFKSRFNSCGCNLLMDKVDSFIVHFQCTTYHLLLANALFFYVLSLSPHLLLPVYHCACNCLIIQWHQA